MTDMARVRRNHNRAVMVGQRLNGSPLNYMDLTDLFACCSDVPELEEEVEQLRDRLKSQERTIKAARAWVKKKAGSMAPVGDVELELISSVQFLPSEG